jgi:hypothetical protein
LLPAVADYLIENAEFIADAIAKRWHFNRRERIHETRCKPAQPSVTKARLFFLRDEFIEIVPKLTQCLTRHFGDPEIEQIVRQMRPRQIFG